MILSKETPYLNFIFLTIILFPILGIYGCGIPGWSIASVLNLGIALMTLPKIKIPRDLKIMPKWLFILFLDAVILYYLSGPSSILPLSEIQTFLLFLVAFYYVRPQNIQIFTRLYKVTAIVCLTFFFLQVASFHVLEIKVSGILHFLPLAIYDNNADWVSLHDESVRFSSFFSEPAHFTYFLIPLVSLELNKVKKNWTLIGMLVMGIILSTSGTGLLALAVILGIWCVSGIDFKKKGNVTRTTFIAIVLFAGLAIFMRTEIASEYVERQAEMSIDYEGGSRSGFMRLWRGYYVYSELPTSRKIIGLNNPNALIIYEQRSLFSETFRTETDHFYNGMSMLLTQQGIIGMVLFILLIWTIWKRTDKTAHLIIVCFVTYMLMESVYLNYRMAFYLVIAWNLVRTPKRLTSVLI